MFSWIGFEVHGIGQSVAPVETMPPHDCDDAPAPRGEALGAPRPCSDPGDIDSESGFVDGGARGKRAVEARI